MPRQKTGGRQKGTPNKNTLIFRQALDDGGCSLPAQIKKVLDAPDASWEIKAELLQHLMPFAYPQQKPIDPDGYLTVEQAAGMLGAQMAKVRRALEVYIPDPMVITQVMEAIREG